MPRNKYPEQTVQKILDVSLKLFMEKGYEQTTVLDIVDQLGGMTRGAFYHHFKSKEEVLDALGDKLFYDSNPFTAVKNDNHLNGLEKIKKVLKLNFANEELQAVNKACVSFLKNPRILAEYIENTASDLVPAMEVLIQAGMEDGSIKPGNPKVLAELFLILGNIWIIPSIFPGTQGDMWKRVEMIKQVLDGVGLPIFDDDIMEEVKKNVEQLYSNKMP